MVIIERESDESSIKDSFKRYFTYASFIQNYFGVLYLDGPLIDKTLNVNVHILNYDGYYIGHLFSWKDVLHKHRFPESKFVLAVNGIRASIENFLARLIYKGYKGVGTILIDSVIYVARKLEFEWVRVIQPLPIMEHMLEKYGFVNYGNDNFDLELTELIESSINSDIIIYLLLL